MAVSSGEDSAPGSGYCFVQTSYFDPPRKRPSVPPPRGWSGVCVSNLIDLIPVASIGISHHQIRCQGDRYSDSLHTLHQQRVLSEVCVFVTSGRRVRAGPSTLLSDWGS